jgi:tetratricopeptide (TPR) repeat protein
MGKFEESIVQYRKALAINPKFESSRYGISADEMYLGRPEAAQAILQEMADKAENESDQRAAYFGMAILACDGGKFDQALKPVDKMYDLSVARKDPTAIALVLQLQGWIMVEMGNYDGAKRKFDDALQSIGTSNLPQEVRDNWTLRHHFDLAALAIAQRDYAAAKAHAAEFRKGAEQSKDPGELQQVHEMAGRIALAEKDYANAVVELQQADLQDARTLYWLGLAYQGKGDAAKAKDFFEKAAAFDSLPSIHYAFIRTKVQKMLQNRGTEGKDPALQSLYDQHRWFELRQMIEGRDAPASYKGAVASAFNDAVAAEKYLHEAITLHPTSDSAEDAQSMLAYLHIRSGQYKRAVEQLDDVLKVKPVDEDVQNARVLFAAWSKYPDQSTIRVRPARIHADIGKDGVKLPVPIHGKTVHWLLDTGANFSMMSESEARMLGVGIDEASASVADSAGGSAKMRTAVVNKLAIAEVEMRNVAFLIVPDSQEPMSDWPRGERGVIGIQIAAALQSIRWNRNGIVEVSSGSRQSTKDGNDLCFDGLSPVARMQFEGKELDFDLDTGDQSGSQLWTRFANDFPALVKERGTESKQEITQVGGANERATIVLPEISLRIGGLNTELRPAQVFSKLVGDDFHHGLIGMDLLSRHAKFE